MADLNSLLTALKELVGPAPDEAEIKANMKLNEAGSVMGSKKQAQAALDRSPVLSTINELLGSLNPVENISGPGQAGFAPIRTAAEKKIVKAMFKAAPENVDLINQLPQKLKVLPERVALPAGVPSGWYHGPTKRLGVDPSVMAGKVPQDKLMQAFADALAQMQGGGMTGKQLVKTGAQTSLGNLPRVAGHEGQHFINDVKTLPEMSAKFAGTSTRPSTIINKIAPVLPMDEGGSQVASLIAANNPSAALDEALAYLREASIRDPQSKQIQALVDELLPKPAPVARGIQFNDLSVFK